MYRSGRQRFAVAPEHEERVQNKHVVPGSAAAVGGRRSLAYVHTHARACRNSGSINRATRNCSSPLSLQFWKYLPREMCKHFSGFATARSLRLARLFSGIESVYVDDWSFGSLASAYGCRYAKYRIRSCQSFCGIINNNVYLYEKQVSFHLQN